MTDGGLVDVDDLVEVLDPFDLVVLADRAAGLVQLVGERVEEHAFHQRGLARPGDAGDAHEVPERNAHVDVFEVVLAGAAHHELPVAARAAADRDRNVQLAAQVRAGQRLPAVAELARPPGRDESAPLAACARAEIDDVVGPFEGVAVVLDQYDGIAQVLQGLEGVQ